MASSNKFVLITFGVLLTALVAGMGTTVSTTFAVYADTQAIRAELVHMGDDIENNEGDIEDLQTAVVSINTDIMENKNNIKSLRK